MNTRRNIILTATVLLVMGGLVLGVMRLFELTFATGESYQPYSSLRADPLGAMVIHDSLAECENITVLRNYSPVREVNLESDATFILLACRGFGTYIPTWHSGSDLKQFVRRGGRLVITLFPRQRSPYEPENEDDGGKDPDSGQDNDKQSDAEEDTERNKDDEDDNPDEEVRKVARRRRIHDVWKLKVKDVSYSGPVTARLAPELRDTGLPALLECQSSARLEELDKAWNVIYSVDDTPVIVEREMGSGTIVFSTLSFPFSNEAMRGNRSTELLTWALGQHDTIVFDEFHHGIVSSPGIAALARGYSLEWVIGALLLLAVLFIWKSASRLVPAAVQDPEDVVVSSVGKDSASGLKNLLRRSIPPSEMLEACLAEWEKDVPGAPLSKAEKHMLNEIILAEHAKPGRTRNYSAVYNSISSYLKDRRFKESAETDNDSQEEQTDEY